MPKEERLSAVAKRRRLNGTVSNATSSPSNISRSESPATSLLDSAKLATSRQSVAADNLEQDENTFSALVSKDVVHFSNFREVERLTDESIKIRLSKAQKCAISGRYSLWVKEGAIEVFGATIEASSELHSVYAPSSFDVPSILALTSVAEIEVSSCDELPLPWLGFSAFTWTSVVDECSFHGSFFVHGYSNPLRDGILEVNYYEGSFANAAARTISHSTSSKAKAIEHKVLLCGKQSPGVAATTMAVINSMMTSKLAARNTVTNRDVLFLDLDADLPTFAPPGTVSLVHVRKPVLGPSFAYVGVWQESRKSQAVKIIKIERFNRSDHRLSKSHQLDSFFALAKKVHQREKLQLPLLVKANGYLEQLEENDAPSLAKIIDPGHVLCFGSEAGSNSGYLGELVAKTTTDCAFSSVPTPSSKDAALQIQHELLLKSYFHSHGSCADQSRWTHLPLELDQQYHVRLTFGSDDAIISDILFDMQSRANGIYDIVNGCMVAICLHQDLKRNSTDLGMLRVPNRACLDGDTSLATALTHNFLGYGVVAGFDVTKGEVWMVTPIPSSVFELHKADGNKIDLIAQQADLDGRFDASWVLLECETMADRGFPSPKAIHSRGLCLEQSLV